MATFTIIFFRGITITCYALVTPPPASDRVKALVGIITQQGNDTSVTNITFRESCDANQF